MDDLKLASILRRMYDDAKRNEAVSQINLFGILYAEEIKASSSTLKELVALSGINMGYVTEVSKGVKLAKYVVLKEGRENNENN